MSQPRLRSRWPDRLERALLVTGGAVLLGPLLPAAVFAAGAALARLVPDGAGSQPALPFLATARDILMSSYFDGGGLAALMAGGLLGLAILWRDRVGLLPALALTGLVALGVGLAQIHAVPRRYGGFPALAFALVAVASAGALIRLTARLHLLDAAGFPPRPGEG